MGLARPEDEFRPRLPSSMSDISSEVLFSRYESRCESSRFVAMDWERNPLCTGRVKGGGKELRLCEVMGYGMEMGCEVDETEDVVGE